MLRKGKAIVIYSFDDVFFVFFFVRVSKTQDELKRSQFVYHQSAYLSMFVSSISSAKYLQHRFLPRNKKNVSASG